LKGPTGVANLGTYKTAVDTMIGTDFFQCDRGHIESRVDSEPPKLSSAPLIVRHCPDSKRIAVHGKATRFQERQGGFWADVQRWIDAA